MRLRITDRAAHPRRGIIPPPLLTPRPVRLALATAVGIAALAVTACGGDGGSGPVAATISLSPTEPTLNVGETITLVGTPVDANQRVVTVAGQMTWTSSAPAVATVDNTGKVTAVSAGTSDVRAAIGSVSGSTRVTVLRPPVARVDVAPTSVAFGRSQTRQLTASVFAANNSALTDRTVTWATSNAAVATLSATTGTSVTVTAVAPGDATVSATSEGVKRDVAVTVQPDPAIAFTPAAASLGTTAGGPNPAAAIVTVSNSGGGTLGGLATGAITYTAGQPAGWLTAAFEGATAAPAPLTLRAVTGSLPLGAYTASVPVTSTSPGASPRSLSVTFSIGAAITLGANPTTVSFTAPGGTGNPGSQTVNVVSVNGSVIPGLTVGAIEYSGAANGWLTASLSGTSTPAALTLQASVGSLATGSYTANVPIAASSATNSPLKVGVTLVVPPPSIAASPGSRSFVATQGIGTAAAQTVAVTNGGRGALTGLQTSIAYGAGATNWLNAQLSSTTAPATLTLTPVANAIARGGYSATVTVTAPGVAPQTIAISYQLVYTFDSHIAGALANTVLPAGCSNSSCHSVATNQAPVMASGSGDVYARLMAGYVTAGNPGASKLYQRLNGSPSPMPPAGVIPALRDAVAAWITDGARRN